MLSEAHSGEMRSPATSASAEADTPGAPPGFLPTRGQFFLLLAVYFLIHLIARTLASEAAGIDDADQLVLGQRLAWGYGPQPPLYTWLLKLFLCVPGPAMFAPTLLRELMLFGISLLTYLNARRLSGSHACGVVAAVALQFHPTICWESQRELNHSILASLLVLGMLLAILNLRTDRWGAYLWLGATGALATLSKYNGALIFALLLAAAVSLPGLRPRVLCWRMAAGLGLCLAMLAPHLWWVLEQRDRAFASLYKFGIRPETPWAKAVAAGLGDGSVTALVHIAPLVLVFAVVCWGPIFIEKKFRLATDETRMIWRALLLLCAAGIVSVLAFKVTGFKDRWFQPVFIWVPIVLAVGLRESLTGPRLRVILLVGLLCAGLVAVLMPGRLFLTERLNKRDVLNAPFRRLAPKLAPYVSDADFIVADSWMAGNLRFWFPEKVAVTPELVPDYTIGQRRCLVVWEVKPRQDPPKDLAGFARRFTGQESVGTPVYVEQLWHYHHRKPMRVGLLLLEQPARSSPISSD